MLWIFAQNQQSFVHVHEVSVTGKKIEGMIAGGDTWVNNWSQSRCHRDLQNAKSIKKKPPFHCKKVVFVYDGVFVKAKNKGMLVPTRVVANRNIPQMNRKWLAEKTSARMRKTMRSPAMLYDGTKRRL